MVFLTILFIENFLSKLKLQIIRYCTRTEVVGGEWIVLNEAGGVMERSAGSEHPMRAC